MKHALTHYKDIVQDDTGEWIAVPGIECQACGAVWPCDHAGEEYAVSPLVCPYCGAEDEMDETAGGTVFCASCGEEDL